MNRPHIDRRSFLKAGALGFAGGSWATRASLSLAADVFQGHPLAPKAAHHRPRAKNLIFIFLTGGFSHLDTFDPKPALKTHENKSVAAVGLRGTSQQPLMPSPFQFQQHGQSGLWISELFPELSTAADDLCVIRSLHTNIVEHFQGVLAMHTGSATVPLPSIGAWLSYGLGTTNPNLPSYMVLCERLPYAGSQVWDSNFLPPIHQGMRIIPGDKPIPDLDSNARSVKLHELEQIMLRDVNRLHAESRPRDLNLRARMTSFEIAQSMMRVAPVVFDITQETQATRELYGDDTADNKSFSRQCLLARRLVEQGVRCVELIDTGSNNNWDAHGNMQDHRPKAKRVDRAIAGLIKDLKQRGLLDETLIAVCTEFGRTPWTDKVGTKGRNHYAKAFSSLLVGGGVKGGMTYGETDEFGAEIVSAPCHVHDYHATILHLMGIDHTKLTYRYAGRDFRLTDVHGTVLQDVLA